MVVPVKLLPMAGTTVVVSAQKEEDGGLLGERVLAGSFSPMVGDVAETTVRDEDVAEHGTLIAAASARWARPSAALAGRLRELATEMAIQEDSPLSPDEAAGDLRAFLLALQPTALTHIASPKIGPGLGYGDPGGLAVIWLFRPGWGQAGDARAAAGVRDWIDAWRAEGRPGMDQLTPVMSQQADGWSVAVRLGKTPVDAGG